MKKLLTFLSLIISLNCFGQIGFQEHVVTDDSNSTDGASSVYAADIDGDGDMDLISASFLDDKIAWYENIDGLGNFGEQQIISRKAVGALSVYVADIDSDGDMDILAAASNSRALTWYKNTNGLGNFSEQIISENAIVVSSIHAADIDNDGDLDILTASAYSISWYKNIDGKGNFGNEQIILTSPIGTTPISARSVYSEDMDGDGDKDILAALNNNNIITWFENTDGLGNFGEQKIISTTASGAIKVYAADIDGDSDMDILSASYNDNKIAWYENTDGLGNFSTQKIITTTANAITSFFVSDIDSDGNIDVISSFENTIAWYKNMDGKGNFGEQQVITNNAYGAASVYVTDVDNDGNMDILSASYLDDKIAWYKNTDGLGNFGQQQIITKTKIKANAPTFVYASDLDSDSNIDIIFTSFTDSKIAWYKNIDGQGNFGEQKTVASLNLTINKPVIPTHISDLNGDGYMDVIITFLNQSEIIWYKNIDGQGAFSEQIILPSKLNLVNFIYTTDIDGDGDMDILTIFDENIIAWLENIDGQGNFGEQQIISNKLNVPTSIYATDIDKDGDMDILSTSVNDNKIVWFENTDGLGNFGEQQIISTDVKQPFTVLSNDIDGDSDMDIISISINDKKIAWYENTDGQGSFGEQNIISINEFTPTSLFAIDIDKDGDIDIISSSFADNKIVWFENMDGHGNFGEQQIISIKVVGPYSIYATDIDKDGDIDILSASWLDDKIAWYENLGILGNEISGKINLDKKINGCDSSDLAITDVMIVADNGTNSFSTFSQADGSYSINTNEGNFTTSITSMFPDYYLINMDSDTTNFVGSGNTDTINFCVEAKQSLNDINITIIPTSQARPGFDADYQLVYHNVGTTQLDGNILLEFNGSKLTFLNASETLASQTSSTLNFDYTDLNPFETRTIDVQFNITTPPTVNIGDVLNFIATINPLTNDATADDNVFSFNQLTIGSYDPNDITVLEGDKILLAEVDKYLHYVIRFQNTGTADAINVKVNNILDANLDWNSLQLESISHTNHIEIKDGNQVSFIFNNIHLADSTTNEKASHGFIAYKIKPKSNVSIGDIMSNEADIFFDFNPAVETNTVTTEVVEPVGTNSIYQINFSIYPNPTSNTLNINSETKIIQIEIYNNLGQLVLATTNQDNINITSLSNGLYFCKVKDVNGDFGIRKVVKE